MNSMVIINNHRPDGDQDRLEDRHVVGLDKPTNRQTHNLGILMKRKDIYKDFNLKKKPLVSMVYIKIF